MLFSKKPNMSMLFRSYIGFTLAEVIIVMGIIGIVAEMTIPTLVNNINKSTYASGVLKYQAVFSQAFSLYMTQNNLSSLRGDLFNNGSSWTPASSKVVWDRIKPLLQVSKDCGITADSGCFASGSGTNVYKCLNPSYYSSYLEASDPDTSTDIAKGILNDGVSVSVQDTPDDCVYDESISGQGKLASVCGWIYIDVNGAKPPNQSGRDLFSWSIVADGSVIPTGLTDNEYFGCNPASTDISEGSNGAPGEGQGCTAKLILEKTMNY